MQIPGTFNLERRGGLPVVSRPADPKLIAQDDEHLNDAPNNCDAGALDDADHINRVDDGSRDKLNITPHALEFMSKHLILRFGACAS